MTIKRKSTRWYASFRPNNSFIWFLEVKNLVAISNVWCRAHQKCFAHQKYSLIKANCKKFKWFSLRLHNWENLALRGSFWFFTTSMSLIIRQFYEFTVVELCVFLSLFSSVKMSSLEKWVSFFVWSTLTKRYGKSSSNSQCHSFGRSSFKFNFRET